jgi:hypothetical protein
MKIEVTRQMCGSWVAIDADNYEAESDSLGSWSNSPIGHGNTAIEAVQELLAEIEERANAAERRHYA